MNNNALFSCMVSVGQEFRSVLNRQFSSRVFHEVATSMKLTEAVAMRRLGWAGRFISKMALFTCLKLMLRAGQGLLHVDIPMGLLSILTTWWLASPIMCNSKDQG